jgi:hypothetical protein
MAATEALERQPGSAQGAVTADRLGSVLRTTRRKSAVASEKRAEQHLVSPDQELEKSRHAGTVPRGRCRHRPLKLAVSAKFGYNTAISFSGDLYMKRKNQLKTKT